MPEGLRQAIAEGKKILVLINPPYAEAGNTLGNEGKTDVATTRVASSMADYGDASRELFTQFVARIAKEMPTATLAMFSKLKYVNAPNFEKFRQHWRAKYLGGFVVHSKAFEGLKGDFPIGFLVWQTANTPVGAQFIARKDIRDLKIAPTKTRPLMTEITTEVLDKKSQAIGEKSFYNLPNTQLLTNWIGRQKPSEQHVLPLINAVTPITKTKGVRLTTWSDGVI